MIGYKITSPAGTVWEITEKIDDKWFAISSAGIYLLFNSIDSLNLLVDSGFGDPVPDEKSELIGEEL